jgi:GTPase Era involved in 16S rRNA processing
MNLGNITLITPPDKLFNLNLSYLLVKPSNHVKEQLNKILSQIIDDVNVFIYDAEDHDTGWLLSVAQQADIVIIDIDNCDQITQKFVTFMLAQPNAHYITNDELTPYGLISKNRIYNLDWIVEQLLQENDEENDDDESQE